MKKKGNFKIKDEPEIIHTSNKIRNVLIIGSFICVFVVVLAIALTIKIGPKMEKRPNIIVILADDLGKHPTIVKSPKTRILASSKSSHLQVTMTCLGTMITS